ncbi:MAG: hypothetical protein U0X93_14045 [Anaerolineales bacterium]
MPGFVKEPAPIVGFSNFGDMAMDLTANFWIDAQMTNTVAAKDSALSMIKNVFDKGDQHPARFANPAGRHAEEKVGGKKKS